MNAVVQTSHYSRDVASDTEAVIRERQLSGYPNVRPVKQMQ
jgi:hypothetical protein